MDLQKLTDKIEVDGINLGEMATSTAHSSEGSKYNPLNIYELHEIDGDTFMYPTRYDELCYSDLLYSFNEALKGASVASINFNDTEKGVTTDSPSFALSNNEKLHKVREVSLVLSLDAKNEFTLALIKFISSLALPIGVLNDIMTMAIQDKKTKLVLPDKVTLDSQAGFIFAEDPRVNYKDYMSGKKDLLIGVNYSFELASSSEMEEDENALLEGNI